MTNDSADYSSGRESELTAKSPKLTSINFIRQFARVYSATKGIEFSYCILN